MSHDEAAELLGAHALDALDQDEAAMVEAHVSGCPRCRDELRSHREVAGLLAFPGGEAPEGMWDRVAARLIPGGTAGDPAGDRGPEGLRLVGLPSAHGPAAARRSWWVTGVSVLAAAAVVVVAVLGVEVMHLRSRTDRLDGALQALGPAPTMAQVERALAVPGARKVVMRSSPGGPAVLDAVILPSGQGYTYSVSLPALPATKTYQLWGVTGGQVISYGLMGPAPDVVAFRAAPGVQTLAVTAEVAGGVPTTTRVPVASADL